MNFFTKMFGGEKPAPAPTETPTPKEKLGDTSAEQQFFGEKTNETEAWEAQRAAETAEREQKEKDMVAAATARREAIAEDAVLVDEGEGETIVRGDEEEFEGDKAANG